MTFRPQCGIGTHPGCSLRRGVWGCLVVGLALAAGSLGAQEDEGQLLRGFRVPEYDENMTMTSQLFGDLAIFRKGGWVEIQGVKLNYYNPAGDVTLQIVSDECQYHQERGEAESEAPITITRMDEDMTVTGTGYTLDAKNQVLHIKQDAVVRFHNVNLTLGEAGDRP